MSEENKSASPECFFHTGFFHLRLHPELFRSMRCFTILSPSQVSICWHPLNMDKMKLTQEKCVAHNHTGHCSVPVIRKLWNQQLCFLCFQWTLSKGGSGSLAPSSPTPKAKCCGLQSWHLQQGEISLSLLCCGCGIVNSYWYHKTGSSGKHLNL